MINFFAVLEGVKIGPITLPMDGVYDTLARFLTFGLDLMDKAASAATSIFSSSPTSSDKTIAAISSGLKGGVTSSMVAFESLGYAICIMFFIFQFVQMITSDQLTLEQFIKKFCWLFVGLFMVSLAPKMYQYCLEFGDAFTSLLSSKLFNVQGTATFDQQEQIVAIITQELDGAGYMEVVMVLLSAVAFSAPLAILALAIYVIMYVIAVTRLIEISVRGALLPIGLSLFCDEGWRGAGGRYLRKFLAVCAQGAGLCLVGKIMGFAITMAYQYGFDISNSSSMMDFILQLVVSQSIVLAIGVAAILAMHKSQQIITDVFGAQ